MGRSEMKEAGDLPGQRVCGFLPDLPARERANPPLIEDVLRGIPVSRADRCPRCRQPYPTWDPARTGELCYSCLRAEARSQEAGYPGGRKP